MKRHTLLAALVAFGVAVTGAAILSAEPEGLARDLDELGSTDPAVRDSAVKRLSTGDGRLVTKLLNELDEDHPSRTKGAIVEVVRKVGVSSSHAGQIKDLLKSNDAAVRSAAVRVAMRSGGSVRAELASRMTDPAELPTVRTAAAVALGSAGPAARAKLLAVTRKGSEHAVVRRAAMRGLALCSPEGAADVKAIVEDGASEDGDRRAAMNALVAEGAQSLTSLRTLVTAPWPWVRVAALQGLGDRDPLGEIATIRGRLADASGDVRLQALRVIIANGLENTERGEVAKRLQDADVRVQCLACQSIARSSKDLATKLQNSLRGLLVSANFKVRYEAALALKAHGDTAGAATMRNDKNGAPNDWQKRLATDALIAITGGAK